MLPPHPELPPQVWLLFGAFEFAIRIITLSIVPEHCRASTSTVWLLPTLLWLPLGMPLYIIFGSWRTMGRQLDDDPEARQSVDAIVAGSIVSDLENYEVSDWPSGLPIGPDNGVASIMRLSGILGGSPASTGRVGRPYDDTAETFRAIAAGVGAATHHVNALYYQTS